MVRLMRLLQNTYYTVNRLYIVLALHINLLFRSSNPPQDVSHIIIWILYNICYNILYNCNYYNACQFAIFYYINIVLP